jgi:hypothetical protein
MRFVPFAACIPTTDCPSYEHISITCRLGVEPHILGPYIFKAVANRDFDCLRRFVRVGAVVDCTDLDGRTPLFLAAAEGDMDAVRTSNMLEVA